MFLAWGSKADPSKWTKERLPLIPCLTPFGPTFSLASNAMRFLVSPFSNVVKREKRTQGIGASLLAIMTTGVHITYVCTCMQHHSAILSSMKGFFEASAVSLSLSLSPPRTYTVCSNSTLIKISERERNGENGLEPRTFDEVISTFLFQQPFIFP
jgi:hypothetical protein